MLNAIMAFKDINTFISNFASNTYKGIVKVIKKDELKHTSIEKYSKDLTAIFPNIVDKTISPDVVQTLNRCVEVKNANLLRLLLISIGKSNLTSDSSEILKKFHRNFDDLDLIDFQLSESQIESIKINFNIENYKNNVFINENSLNDRFYTKSNRTIKEHLFSEAGIDRAIDVVAGSSKTSTVNKSNKIVQTDIELKHLNTLSPTLVEVSIPTRDMFDDTIVVITMLFGVKSKIYPTSREDILDNILSYKKSRLFKFIQLSTGEIKFFKDFIFNIDHIKNTVALNKNKNERDIDKLWKILQRRSRNQNKIFSSNSMDNASIATLMLNITTVEELVKTNNINLLDNKTAGKFMAENNLMNLFIVDEIQEIVYIMSDSGDNIFTELSFNYINKEMNSLSNQKVIKNNISVFG